MVISGSLQYSHALFFTVGQRRIAILYTSPRTFCGMSLDHSSFDFLCAMRLLWLFIVPVSRGIGYSSAGKTSCTTRQPRPTLTRLYSRQIIRLLLTCVAVMICVIVVNTHTDREKERELLTSNRPTIS